MPKVFEQEFINKNRAYMYVYEQREMRREKKRCYFFISFYPSIYLYHIPLFFNPFFLFLLLKTKAY